MPLAFAFHVLRDPHASASPKACPASARSAVNPSMTRIFVKSERESFTARRNASARTASQRSSCLLIITGETNALRSQGKLRKLWWAFRTDPSLPLQPSLLPKTLQAGIPRQDRQGSRTDTPLVWLRFTPTGVKMRAWDWTFHWFIFQCVRYFQIANPEVAPDV